MGDSLEKILELAKKNVATNPRIVGQDAFAVTKLYIEEIKKEVAEAGEELRSDNAVRLTDELSDIIWDNIVLLQVCADRGLIDSVESVYEHALCKYTERAPGFTDTHNENWNKIKDKQKADLARRHQERYGE